MLKFKRKENPSYDEVYRKDTPPHDTNLEVFKKICEEKDAKYQKYQEIDTKSKGVSNSLEEILEKWKNQTNKKSKSVYKEGNTIIVK